MRFRMQLHVCILVADVLYWTSAPQGPIGCIDWPQRRRCGPWGRAVCKSTFSPFLTRLLFSLPKQLSLCISLSPSHNLFPRTKVLPCSLVYVCTLRACTGQGRKSRPRSHRVFCTELRHSAYFVLNYVIHMRSVVALKKARAPMRFPNCELYSGF